MTDDTNPTTDPSTGPPEGILDPEDLDLSADEHVADLGGGRFVVSTDESEPADPSPPRAAEGVAAEAPDPSADPAGVRAVEEAYVIDLAVKTDRAVAHGQFRSNDIREVVGDALRWYAARVDPETPPEEVLDVLLAASLE